MTTLQTSQSIPAGLIIACLLVGRLAAAGESATPVPQEREKQEEVWLWTVGTELRTNWAMTQKIPTEAVCSAEQLIEFYGARQVMYFESRPHTPEVANRFAQAEKLVLSVGYVLGAKSGTLESLGPSPNLAGVIIDDFSTNISQYSRDAVADVYRRLKARGAHLKLYAVVYTADFNLDFTPYLPFIDVVSLWVWDSQQLADLDRHLESCRKVFASKPIVLGLYLYVYPNNRFMPLELVQFEFRKARDYSRRGLIDGYQVLGSYLVKELQTSQGRWVRDFIQAR